jgi:hypothetical protein
MIDAASLRQSRTALALAKVLRAIVLRKPRC